METAPIGSSQENLANCTSSAAVGRVIANRIFVGNLPPNLVERDLMTLFNRFGKIRDVKIIPENTRNKSYGFVTFFSEVDARRAIQSCLQHDSIMWGDRRLNVAPAVKRASSATNLTTAPPGGYYNLPRIPVNQYYPTPPVPMPAYPAAEVPQTGAAPDPQQVPAVDNGIVQTFVCRIPHHQYSMGPCQYTPGSPAYFLTPNYQPYVQAPAVPLNQASHFGATFPTYGTADSNYRPVNSTGANVNVQPLTPSPSNDNSDAQLEETVDSGQAGDKSNSGETSENSQESGHTHPGPHLGSHPTNPATPTATYPSFPTYLCCQHSCMMSPVSPAHPPAHHSHPPPTTPLNPAALSRSCQMLHAAAAPNCYAPNSPLIYASSPVVYNSARRSTRLQRWNSLDANIGGQVWNTGETGWSRPSLDDSYASETALGGFSRIDRPLRPAYSCQSHVGMFSPFCRSYEYNLWGLGGPTSSNQGDPSESNAIASVGSPSSSTQSSLSLNINLNDNSASTEQVQQSKK